VKNGKFRFARFEAGDSGYADSQLGSNLRSRPSEQRARSRDLSAGQDHFLSRNVTAGAYRSLNEMRLAVQTYLVSLDSPKHAAPGLFGRLWFDKDRGGRRRSV
jgi:hypothetical protein